MPNIESPEPGSTYALEDVPDAVEVATGQRPQVRWNKTNTDPWALSIGANMTAGDTDGR